jgi:hypothetical protein
VVGGAGGAAGAEHQSYLHAVVVIRVGLSSQTDLSRRRSGELGSRSWPIRG